MILSVDANFRLKLKDRGFRDPELGSGWSYFVESDAYLSHLKECPDQEEVYRDFLFLFLFSLINISDQ